MKTAPLTLKPGFTVVAHYKILTTMDYADDTGSQLSIHVTSRWDDTYCDYGTSDWGTEIMDYNGPNPLAATALHSRVLA